MRTSDQVESVSSSSGGLRGSDRSNADGKHRELYGELSQTHPQSSVQAHTVGISNSNAFAAREAAHKAIWNDVVWEAFLYYPRLTRVCEYVLRNLHGTVTLPDAARVACLEKTYFSSYFHKKVGISFTAWLRLVRVGRAIRILQCQDITVFELAQQVGFRSVRTFERCFRAVSGTTLRAAKEIMRRRMREGNSQELADFTQILPQNSKIEVLCDALSTETFHLQ